MAKIKVKNPEMMGFKECFGVTALTTTSALSGLLMSTLLMTYMTDYAGLGAWGASLATILLLAARIIDAVDDPLQSFIMDSAKPGRFGKYKPFFLISIMMTALGSVLLYSLPQAISTKPVLVTVWVILFYLIYDVGTSFFHANLLYRTMTIDPNQRAKLVVGPRVWTMILGVAISAFITIIVAVNEAFFHNYSTTFRVVVMVIMSISAVISIIGWMIVKERHVVEPDPEDKVKISDFFALFKVNKAMVIGVLFNLFHGFVWTLLLAAPAYYVKWAFCANLNTGDVNMTLFGTYSLILTLAEVLPVLITSLIAQPLMKNVFKSPVRTVRFSLILEMVGCGMMALAQFTGIMKSVPMLFFISLAITAAGVGLIFVPFSSIEMEIMDYTIYKTGKDRSALTNVVGNLLSKAQTAISSAIVGALLIAIGYKVDSVTGNFAGEISSLPGMINGFIVIMGVIPVILALIAFIVLHFYPITDEVRADMGRVLREKDIKTEAEELPAEKE